VSALRLLRSVWRSLLFALLLVAAVIDYRIRRPKWGAEGAVWIHGWCGRIVRVLGFRCEVEGRIPASGAVVSNHLSYLDILLYSSVQPFVMVAKTEVRGWPLLGWLTAQAGTVYVERGGGPKTYPAVNAAMAEAYRSGLPVLFFPEGTTTDGASVLPFRRGLFHSVLNNGVSLRTAALRYTLESCAVNRGLLWERMFAGGERWDLLRTCSGFSDCEDLGRRYDLATRWCSARIVLFFQRLRRRGLWRCMRSWVVRRVRRLGSIVRRKFWKLF
jgi:1-acyl-sn-glycerol-3-phosphate acyltransferase